MNENIVDGLQETNIEKRNSSNFQNLIVKGEFFSQHSDLCGKIFLLVSFDENRLQKGIVCVSNFTKRFKDDVKLSSPWYDYLNSLNFFVKDANSSTDSRFSTMKERIEELFSQLLSPENIPLLLKKITETSNINMQQFHLNEAIAKPLEEQIGIEDLQIKISHELLEKEKTVENTASKSVAPKLNDTDDDLFNGKTPISVLPTIDPVQGKSVNEIIIGDKICFKLSKNSEEYCCPVIGISYSQDTSRTQIITEIDDEMVGILVLSATTRIKISREDSDLSEIIGSDQVFVIVATALFVLFAILIGVVWVFY